MQGEDKLQLGDYASSDQLSHSSLSLTYLSNMFHVFRMCSFGQNVQQPIHSFM